VAPSEPDSAADSDRLAPPTLALATTRDGRGMAALLRPLVSTTTTAQSSEVLATHSPLVWSLGALLLPAESILASACTSDGTVNLANPVSTPTIALASRDLAYLNFPT